ncbi:importin subunit beta-3-like [Gastrolobium bilobum]|uniref:importin subunit beta-3-like n=1 Tax=Gastrolobium bilobum TaxID=150636 RepID=UPI002AAF764D|nr:importin subunit beta-3-like [Gastrolobium bilobum]
MASTSCSIQRSSSPPPSTLSSPPVSLPRHQLSPPRTYSLEEISRKRRSVEAKQDASLIHGFDLKPHANEILQSEDVSKLQSAIEEFVKTPLKKKIKPKRLFDSLALHYPNAFSFKLAKLLSLQPPLNIRTEAVALLHQILAETHGDNMRKINASILAELKKPLLESLKMENEESLFPLLCETIGDVVYRVYEYPLGGWEELLGYACSCVSGDSKLNSRKGLVLITEFPLEVADSREFWEQGKYISLVTNVLNYSDSTDQKLQELKFDASLVLIGLSLNLWRTKVGASLLPIILEFIDQHAKEKTVVGRVRNLAELISLDIDGELFEGKEGDVFSGMLRLLEMKGASEELRCAAIHVLKELDEVNTNVMESLIKNLSPVKVKRFLSLSMDMLLCVKDDPLWYEVDNEKCEEAGMSESFTRGKFLLRWLSLGGDASIVVPTVFEMVRKTYVADKDWRKRHAGMMALGTIADGHKKDKIQHFEQVERVVLTLLNDLHPRPILRVMSSVHIVEEEIHHTQGVDTIMVIVGRLTLISWFDSMVFPRSSSLTEVGYAVVVIRFFVTNCGLDRTASFGEVIVKILLLLLKAHEKQKLQEEAVETLALIAVSIPANFRKFYDATMNSLKATLLHYSSLPKLLLRAKCLECMSSIVLRVEQDKFKEREVVVAIYSLLSLVEKLRSTDYLIRTHILKALHQFFQCPRVDIDRFMNKVMPMLLRSAQLDIDINDDRFAFTLYYPGFD